MNDLRTAAQQALEAMDKATRFMSDLDYKKLNEAIAALKAALAEPKHKPHCALLKIPSRDCDCSAEPVQEPITTLYGTLPVFSQAAPPKRPAEPVQEPVAWTLTETLNKRVTRTNCYLWFSNPQNSAWTALYTAPPQRKPLSEEEIDRITRDRWGTQLLGVMVQAHREYARAVEAAHGIIETKIQGDKDD